MSLGSIVLRLRQKYGKGLRVAHYRDKVRPRILQTRPVTGLASGPCEIHALTSQSDWLNLIWALKSFYWIAGPRYPLVIHEDGSLDATAIGHLQQHFPEARLIRKREADATVLASLTSHPRCREFRATNHLSPKVFDFRHYLEGDRLFLFDSDILFFAPPQELIRRLEDPAYRRNSVNSDVDTAYTANPAEVQERFGFTLIPKFNSGLGLIHKASLNLDWIEEFLTLQGILSHFWRIEQTMFALCSCRWGVELLPEEYAVRLTGTADGLPSRHYVGKIRHLMYSEGMRKLVQQGFLRDTSV